MSFTNLKFDRNRSILRIFMNFNNILSPKKKCYVYKFPNDLNLNS